MRNRSGGGRDDAPILIGNGQGFWGDSLLGPVQLVTQGALHYLTLDYLAEVTMSIMQKQRARDATAGFARDFLQVVERVLPTCKERGIRIVANAGGVNPRACAEALAALVRKLDVPDVKVGIVEGDDILDRLEHLLSEGETMANMDTGVPLADRLDLVQSANVYLGAEPIAEALAGGADIVVTGRCTDPSLALAPMIHEFGWSMDDYDKLAAGTVAGHIIECGTQSTGGNFTAWREVGDLTRIGYPVVEASPDGSFVVTKQPGTGGMVTTDTVIAQLLYELGDPARYLTPEVVVDFTSIEIEQVGVDRVRVSGVKGSAPTDSYKVSIAMGGGFKATGELTVAGPDAIEKAAATADLLFARLALDGCEFADDERLVEIVGSNVLYRGMVASTQEPHEVVMRVSVRGPDRRKLDRFGMELASLLTSGPPGLTGFAGGRPRASEIVGFWPALLAKDALTWSTSIEAVT
jgi:hypothetical protein